MYMHSVRAGATFVQACLTKIYLAFVLVLPSQLQLITRDPNPLHRDAVNRLGGNEKILETHSSHPCAHGILNELSCVLSLCNGFGVTHSLPHSACLFMDKLGREVWFTT